MNLLTRFFAGSSLTWASAVSGPAALQVCGSPAARRPVPLPAGMPAGPDTGAASKRETHGEVGNAGAAPL